MWLGGSGFSALALFGGGFWVKGFRFDLGVQG